MTMVMARIAQGIVAVLLGTMVSTAFGQLRCVNKEYAQYKQQVATVNGRYNMPLDYCIAEVRQGMWDSSSQPYADCAAEMEKMRDAMIGARLQKLVKFAEAGCQGKHPLN